MILIAAFLLNFSFARETAKPVSLSYRNIIRCNPELSDSTNSFKVDLNKLKELIDKKITTVSSTLHHRIVIYKDADGQQMRLKYTRLGRSADYDLSVESLDSKGTGTTVKIPEAQRINPKQRDIANFLLGATLISDESFFDDAKVNGQQLSYRSSFKNVQELQLSNKVLKKSLSCENQKDLGITCSCDLQ